MLVPEGITNFAVYEGNTEFCGIAEAKTPSVENLTETIKGAGLAGEVEIVFLGHVSAMSMSLNFRTLTKEAMRLATPTQHIIQLWTHQQSRNNMGGLLGDTKVKHVIIGQPKKVDLGKLAPASSADASIEFSVTYFATYVGDKKMLEVDPINFIFFVDGLDYLANTRKALGK